MDRKINLMRKRARLGFLKKENKKIKANAYNLNASFTFDIYGPRVNTDNLLTELIQEIENEQEHNSTLKNCDKTGETGQKGAGDGVEEQERKSEPAPDIYKDDDSFLKSIYEVMGDYNPNKEDEEDDEEEDMDRDENNMDERVN
eukprot:CAMPEP_0202963976 /NCGR_PEP_ID=MMETSP1396-20130829/8032_1 /ASSEMBLY_ACC=CAM_ASM_000872 /TAXON_ID= /ORGANISM="Pseudokeronopsis sp., Strain Brazil" /LENGTH=143 /DNA_ID=CAMNT_0049685673 /DNA_START=606 /DNA_END=1037 /DNA_ORIENTATION=-